MKCEHKPSLEQQTFLQVPPNTELLRDVWVPQSPMKHKVILLSPLGRFPALRIHQDDDDEMLGRKSSHGSSSEVMMVYMCVAGDNKT